MNFLNRIDIVIATLQTIKAYHSPFQNLSRNTNDEQNILRSNTT